MVFEAVSPLIVSLLIGLAAGFIAGFIMALYAVSRQKWGDKCEALNEKWKRSVAELEKDYEVKLEKSNTALEKLAREWQVKYIRDVEGLKRLFRESEKMIRLRSVSSSRRSLIGKFIEKFVPFLSNIPFTPSDMHFLGQPVDYVVFDGLRDDAVKKVVFLEVKTGNASLTKREQSIKEAIGKGQVYWREIKVDTGGEEAPEAWIGAGINAGETAISAVYDAIDCKVAAVKKAGFVRDAVNSGIDGK